MKRLLLLLPFGFSVILLGGDVGRAAAAVGRVGSQTVETTVATQANEGAAAVGQATPTVMSQHQARELGLDRFLRFIRNGAVSFVEKAIQRGRPVTTADLAYARNISDAYNQRIAALQRSAGRREESMQNNYKKIIQDLENALRGSASGEGKGVPASQSSSD